MSKLPVKFQYSKFGLSWKQKAPSLTRSWKLNVPYLVYNKYAISFNAPTSFGYERVNNDVHFWFEVFGFGFSFYRNSNG